MITNRDNELDHVLLWQEIIELREAVKGPDGYATWKDAAMAERLKRIKVEGQLEELRQRHVKLRISMEDLL